MSAIGSLVLTALATVGAVSVAKKIRRRFEENRSVKSSDEKGRTIDMEVDQGSGVWRDPKSETTDT